MRQLQSAWDMVMGQFFSLTRVMGLCLFWLWMLMMFYSIEPYGSIPDARGALYINQIISLAALVATLLFIAVMSRNGVRLTAGKAVFGVSCAAMAAGSLLAPFSDPDTTTGMLALGVGSIMTGSGSAALFMCWLEVESDLGGRPALVELAVSSCIAFILGFVLSLVPLPVSVCVTVALPVGSALLLRRCAEGLPVSTLGQQQELSRQTIGLFVKALAGAALIGGIEGFFDVVSGFKMFEVQDTYGLCLLLAGFVGALLISLIAVFLQRDGVFFSYRLAMLMICLGCLATPFLGDNSTYSSTLIFGGYNGFVMVLCVVCIDVAVSFRVNAVRAVGLGFVALYGGEVLGSLLGYSLEAAGMPLVDLTLVTLVTVSLLFISHLCLFTETDLVKIGIGEVSLFLVDPRAAAGAQERQDGPGEGTPAPAGPSSVDPCEVIVQRFGLSPRESDVLPLLLEGRTIARIQESLFISAGTVSTHIRHIYQKTGANNRQELIDLSHDVLREPPADGQGQAAGQAGAASGAAAGQGER